MKNFPGSFGWVSGEGLKKRWDMNNLEVTELILEFRLTAYDEDMQPLNVTE
jgi:hypothetical protein